MYYTFKHGLNLSDALNTMYAFHNRERQDKK